jgi:hypothetical protein
MPQLGIVLKDTLFLHFKMQRLERAIFYTFTKMKLAPLFFCLISSGILFGQELQPSFNYALGRDYQTAIDFASITAPNDHFHSSFRPYSAHQVKLFSDSSLPFRFSGFGAAGLTIKKEGAAGLLQVMPLLDLEFGVDGLTKKYTPYTGAGAQFRLQMPSRLCVNFSVFGGSSRLPFFLDTTISTQKILPEFGQTYGDNVKGYRFLDIRGYVAYTTANKVFNIQAGRDKHFIGDGYRSILLSDFAPANPYLRFTASIWKLQYSVWYNLFFDVSDANGRKASFRNKYGSFHYLTYNPIKEISIGIFENVIWRGSDTNQSRSFDVNYLNPVVFYRPQEYSLGSPDNSFLGLNLSATLWKRLKLYGQLGLDEFYLKEIRAHRGWWANKQAWQMGAKYVNAFGIKGLMLQTEYNEVRPFTYSHGLVDQNYSHYGMPLAHPLGSNFREQLGLLTYMHGLWSIQADVIRTVQGKDTSDVSANIGANIFRSYVKRAFEYGNVTTQGVKHTSLQSHVRISYLLLPKSNLRVELGYIQRSVKSSLNYQLENPYVYISVKTGLWNRYRDY